jgi:hypothetical protein
MVSLILNPSLAQREELEDYYKDTHKAPLAKSAHVSSLAMAPQV